MAKSQTQLTSSNGQAITKMHGTLRRQINSNEAPPKQSNPNKLGGVEPLAGSGSISMTAGKEPGSHIAAGFECSENIVNGSDENTTLAI